MKLVPKKWFFHGRENLNLVFLRNTFAAEIWNPEHQMAARGIFLVWENIIQSQPLIQDIKLSVAPNFMKGITNYTSNIFVFELQMLWWRIKSLGVLLIWEVKLQQLLSQILVIKTPMINTDAKILQILIRKDSRRGFSPQLSLLQILQIHKQK